MRYRTIGTASVGALAILAACGANPEDFRELRDGQRNSAAADAKRLEDERMVAIPHLADDRSAAITSVRRQELAMGESGEFGLARVRAHFA